MVRPERLHGLSAKSVRKKMRQPSFAAAVDREELEASAAALGVGFDEHVEFVERALEGQAGALGLDGGV